MKIAFSSFVEKSNNEDTNALLVVTSECQRIALHERPN